MTQKSLSDPLSKLKEVFEKALKEDIKTFGENTDLMQATIYGLDGCGKRLRPLIVLMTAKALKNFPVTFCSLSVEYFHTASLIADDLPCMDNENIRRGKASVHQVYPEATALLSSYALICLAFEKISDNVKVLSKYMSENKANEIGLLAYKYASHFAGMHGATKGQFLDLFSKKVSLEEIKKVIYLKTITLFETSFLFGWLFGGGDLEKQNEVMKLARHFGMAFQIADDLNDHKQDECVNNTMNISVYLGKEKTLSLFQQELKALETYLEKLNLFSEDFIALVKRLKTYVSIISG